MRSSNSRTPGSEAMVGHIALLGDSIFDNRAYTGGEPDVIRYLRPLLPPGWKASPLAIDGVTADLATQLRQLPADAPHLVISVGGNDALRNTDALGLPVSSTAEAITIFGDRASRFERMYRPAINAALAFRRKTTVCTIYNGNLSEAEAPLARVGLMVFNDAILRVAFEHRLSVIDLRLVCTEPQDYANPIEPSGAGGQKLADRRSHGPLWGHSEPRTKSPLIAVSIQVNSGICQGKTDLSRTFCAVDFSPQAPSPGDGAAGSPVHFCGRTDNGGHMRTSVVVVVQKDM
jgi:GDSL-like Lipase/Acylhydrolase family